MKTLIIRHARGGFPVLIGSRLESRLVAWLERQRYGRRVVLISHPELLEQYGQGLQDALAQGGFEVVVLSVPIDEESKSLSEAGRLYGELAQNQVDRGTTVLALGGGVIGDLAGFVAATYLRGLPLVHLPTTLLAQVDSSLGCVATVNEGPIKNQIGMFYPPRAVFCDLEALRFLSIGAMENGLAEMINCAMIRSQLLFSLLERRMDRLMALDGLVTEEAIYLAATVKAWIVNRIGYEAGTSQVLSLGHTVGRAIKVVSDYQISHGQAMAIGMVTAGKIARRLQLLPGRDLGRLSGLVALAGLPLSLPDLDLAAILEVLRQDAVLTCGRLRFVLPVSIGQIALREISPELVVEVLAES